MVAKHCLYFGNSLPKLYSPKLYSLKLTFALNGILYTVLHNNLVPCHLWNCNVNWA